MVPWELIERVATPDGKAEMSLHRRDQEYSIRIDGLELMNSRMHGSEAAMAELACASVVADQPRVLIGGLGMGFTLAGANRALPVQARIVVAELMGPVVRWNRGPLSKLAGRPLEDARVTVHEGDIRELLESSQGAYDAILLDVDNGPEGLTQASNAWLYGSKGLSRTAKALKSGGILSVWSAAPDGRFSRRLGAAGFQTKVHRVSARPGGKGPTHCIWVATTPGGTQ